jgi:hypothetical protein
LSVLFFLSICSCSTPPESSEPDYILRTMHEMVSVNDFEKELDLKISAYPYLVKDDPDEYNQMVIQLVKGLSEEIVLLSEAGQKNVVVTDQEVEAAEAAFKADYPEDSFDQLLLKNAISYEFWKKRFKKDMIINRLIDEELRQKIEISSQELYDFYKKKDKNQRADSFDPDAENTGITFQEEKELVARLRLKKTQDSYGAWIQQLFDKYPVDIDRERLKTFLIDKEQNKEAEK